MMIPRDGELFDLNMSAVYDGPGDDGEVPTITIGDLSVSFYVSIGGIARISVHTDSDLDPRIGTHTGEGGPLLEFAINGNTVHTA